MEKPENLFAELREVRKFFKREDGVRIKTIELK